MKHGLGILGALGIPVLILAMFWLADIRPGYFANVTYLGGLLLLEVLIVSVWHYESSFFAVLMLSFFWAGCSLPLAGAGAAARWVFLLVGAVVGIVKWAERDQRQPFRAFHLVALLCFLSALVSSLVSNQPSISLLKAVSLMLLFLYGSCGARIAIADRQAVFFRGLLIACEGTAYLVGFTYLAAHYELFGNRNSLGAIMGVLIVPVLAWGVMVSEGRLLRHRRMLALGIAIYLLYVSLSRAGILAAGLTIILMCIALRRGNLLLKGALAVIFLVTAVAVLQPGQFDALVDSFTTDVIYKGKPEQGLLGSRNSPWQDTVQVIKQSPWFGSGFGTDFARDYPAEPGSIVRTTKGSVREHGNSYLALLQYVGLLGVVPFAALLVMILGMIYRVCFWTWRTQNPGNHALPFALICVAGLTHAFFEDWLFAVGYYLNVFFWISAFLLSDLQPQSVRGHALRTAWNQAPVSSSPFPVSANQ
jgi:O-antigen ligase